MSSGDVTATDPIVLSVSDERLTDWLRQRNQLETGHPYRFNLKRSLGSTELLAEYSILPDGVCTFTIVLSGIDQCTLVR